MTDKSKWRFRYKSLKVQESMQEFEGFTEKELIKHIWELRKEIIELENENKVMQIKLNSNADHGKEEELENSLSEKNFNTEWSYPTKVAFLITIKNKPLTSEEIHRMLVKLDKHYSSYADPKGTLSVYLTMVVKRGRIKKIKLPGIKTLYFALPEWVNEKGALNSEFKEHTNPFK